MPYGKHGKRNTAPDPQLGIDFTSAQNELLAKIRSLEHAVEAQHLGPVRLSRVIELLVRIVLCSGADLSVSHARVNSLGAAIDGRHRVGEKTIRRWVKDAEELGVLAVDRPSQRYGGHISNKWEIKIDRLTTMTREVMGRSRAGHEDGPRPVGTTGPQYASLKANKQNPPPPTPPRRAPGSSPATRPGWEEVEGVLRGWQIGTYQMLIDQAAAAGETPHAFLARIRHGERTIAHPPNSRKINEPAGALCFWLKSRGIWPTRGIIDPDTPQPATRPANPDDCEYQIRFLTRWLQRQGRTDDQIRAELEARGLLEPQSQEPIS